MSNTDRYLATADWEDLQSFLVSVDNLIIYSLNAVPGL